MTTTPPSTPAPSAGPRTGLATMLWRAIVWIGVKIWGILWNDKVPLVINIILIAATAYVTYVVAPKINGTFERQKIQSAYVLENLRSINAHISEIYVDVGEISYAMAAEKPLPDESVSSARETISRLNWKVIETAAVLKDDDDIAKLEEFQISLDELRESLDATVDVRSARVLSNKMKQMSVIGVDVIESIGGRASLDPSKRTNDKVEQGVNRPTVPS